VCGVHLHAGHCWGTDRSVARGLLQDLGDPRNCRYAPMALSESDQLISHLHNQFHCFNIILHVTLLTAPLVMIEDFLPHPLNQDP
jgi:hypothetical protein